MNKLSWEKRAYALFLLYATTAIALPAQTFTTLHSFDSTDGAFPYWPLVQGRDGKLYGAANGGANNNGTVFRITPSGTLATLYSFCPQSGCKDGQYPEAALVQAVDGNFYGTTLDGGHHGEGTVFSITPTDTLTTLYSFCSQPSCTDGGDPEGALVQSTDGNFYGITTGGGISGGFGTIFKITPSGTLTTLHSFCSQDYCTDGAYSYSGLIEATNGNFYGTTTGYGANGYGTVFSITPTGTLTTLYNFCSQGGTSCTDGEDARGLTQATDGTFYGATNLGGANGYGTVFRITPTGALTTLHSFCSQGGCADGSYPSPVIQASDGNFYGISYSGGAYGYGTIFKITSGGTLTTLYSFCSQSGCKDGEFPAAALVQDTDGNLYGTTESGGGSAACTDGCGTVFSLSVGLGPFIETQPTFGKAGAVIKILGTSLTGATSVTFNGTPAVFKVLSSSLIGATIPTGATTGTVQVVTPSATLSSNVPFRVQP
jgi:uncharacterized repeat protein (TIGR03803 family)